MLPFHKAVETEFKLLNQMVIDQLHSNVPLVENIGNYIVEGGGKRLRPVSVLLVAKALSGGHTEAVKLATVIEFIHTATLLHDDVVDESDRRRGRDTSNEKWGNSSAVLVGDFIYSRAFQLMVQLKNTAIMGVLADTTNTIAEGEVQQLINAGNPDTSEENYLEVVRKKTAVLFSAATECAAILCHASPEQQADLAAYGNHLGMAFQLQDDVLDYTGDATEMGKNIGDDLAEGKATLPLIYTIQNGSEIQSNLIRKSIADKDNSRIEEVAQAVQESGGLNYTQKRAEKEVALAIAGLQSLQQSTFKLTLTDLAKFALVRSF
jgi:octaprenyl-diphosphate synthase